ncbi:DUF1203 domain-containing protein [Phenylobacterium sp.]|uniref:DUF1203 domain-containing protein n=1 Tax=Phenylobacterium sp. TaxID=1871053 RepID=UPI0027370E0E|nr:DUF1203 domain-containing protein [Phenylobacterium sp.]MDP3852118.1 DUF1203 domain-containing protein [Phenylobacterium sp.]
MSFVVTGLPVEDFRPLFGLSDADLTARGIVRHTATAAIGFPCRITLEDAQAGDTLLLLNYEHQPAETPYRSRHAIFVNESATQTRRAANEIPGCLAVRPHIALRAYDEAGMMTAAEISPGADLAPVIERMLANPQVAYLHAHNAGRGCFAARIDRA